MPRFLLAILLPALIFVGQSSVTAVRAGDGAADRLWENSQTLLRANDYRLPLDTMNRRIWFRGFANFLSQGSRRDSMYPAVLQARSGGGENVDAQTYGFSLGVERRVHRLLVLGIGAGGNWTETDPTPLAGSTDVAALFASVYARGDFRRAYLALDVGYGNNENTTTRREESGWTGRGARNAEQWHVRLECGAWWEIGFARFEPFVAFHHVSFDEEAYRETGDGLPRFRYEQDGYEDSKNTVLLGLRYSWRHAGPLARWEPTMAAGWVHELDATDLYSVGTFSDAPTVFRMRGNPVDEDRFFLGIGFNTSMRKRLELYARYTAEIASGYGQHTIVGGMNWNF